MTESYFGKYINVETAGAAQLSLVVAAMIGPCWLGVVIRGTWGWRLGGNWPTWRYVHGNSYNGSNMDRAS